MRIHSKLALVTFAAAIVFSVAVGTASARNFRVNEPNFEMVFRPVGFTAGGSTVRCDLTVLGRFEERTLPKILGSNAGTVKHLERGACTGGSTTVLAETLPWKVTYQGFIGRLPNITSIRWLLIRFAFRIHTSGGLECLLGTSTTHPGFAEAALEAGGGTTSFRLEERTGIPLSGALCEFAGEGSMEGRGELTNLPRLNVVNFTLI